MDSICIHNGNRMFMQCCLKEPHSQSSQYNCAPIGDTTHQDLGYLNCSVMIFFFKKILMLYVVLKLYSVFLLYHMQTNIGYSFEP